MPTFSPQRKRDREAQRRREKTARRQDIGKRLWPIKRPARRKAALASFRKFSEPTFPPASAVPGPRITSP